MVEAGHAHAHDRQCLALLLVQPTFSRLQGVIQNQQRKDRRDNGSLITVQNGVVEYIPVDDGGGSISVATVAWNDERSIDCYHNGLIEQIWSASTIGLATSFEASGSSVVIRASSTVDTFEVWA